MTNRRMLSVLLILGPMLASADLRQHAGEVREYGTKRFWNETTEAVA